MTARPINPGELLDHADSLAGRGAGPGRPRSIELRRAVSSAYYALFHELSWRGTEALVAEGPGWSTRAAHISRWVTHGDLKALCLAVTGSGNRGLILALGEVHPDVLRVADALVTLQLARHRADYDDLYDLSRANALILIDNAREAVTLSARLCANAEPTYTLFLRLMLSAAQAKSRST